MPRFCDPGCNGTLTIGGVLMNTPAWDVPLLTKLWFAFEQRGESLLIPHAAGRRSTPRRMDETVHDLTFLMNGNVNRLGVPFANPWQGLQTNLAYLQTNVFQPVTVWPGTRAATMTMPTGAPRTAAVVAELIEASPVNDPEYAEFVLRLTIPAGMFV